MAAPAGNRPRPPRGPQSRRIHQLAQLQSGHRARRCWRRTVRQKWCAIPRRQRSLSLSVTDKTIRAVPGCVGRFRGRSALLCHPHVARLRRTRWPSSAYACADRPNVMSTVAIQQTYERALEDVLLVMTKKWSSCGFPSAEGACGANGRKHVLCRPRRDVDRPAVRATTRAEQSLDPDRPFATFVVKKDRNSVRSLGISATGIDDGHLTARRVLVATTIRPLSPELYGPARRMSR